jgi:hypothetical protein
MVEAEIVKLYEYSIRYKSGEKDEYTVILVSDNMKDMIELIADREMVETMKDASKWLEISDFLWASRKDEKWYHLFDINEQDLAVKFGYDVLDQHWTCQFKDDCPESVKDFDEVMVKFEDEMKTLHPNDEWEKSFASGGVLGDALYESKHVQDAIHEKKRERDMHDAQELDAGLGVIEEIVKGEEE